MYKFSKILASAAIVLIFLSSSASAVSFSGMATGEWTNVVSTDWRDVYSVSNDDDGGLATFNWGRGGNYPATPFDNQFTFDGIGSDGAPLWNTSDEEAFLLGNFSYRNGSTYNSAGIDGVDLMIELAIMDPVEIINTYDFGFSIVNTTNSTGNPVADGDIVIASSVLSDVTFNYDGIDYTLELLGFSSDGGQTVRADFSSPEGAIAEAGIYGRITAADTPNPAVPEPGTWMLITVGLSGLVFVRRKMNR
ncbi:choice-of-anchor K domain-containing protein [Desulfococcaceae bacterium HSG7]|nr:choice-of-anchor K domain-containing protein [Desulfococcaceae bacterium HSG7]